MSLPVEGWGERIFKVPSTQIILGQKLCFMLVAEDPADLPGCFKCLWLDKGDCRTDRTQTMAAIEEHKHTRASVQ